MRKNPDRESSKNFQDLKSAKHFYGGVFSKRNFIEIPIVLF